jgi:hypothetical protein
MRIKTAPNISGSLRAKEKPNFCYVRAFEPRNRIKENERDEGSTPAVERNGQSDISYASVGEARSSIYRV